MKKLSLICLLSAIFAFGGCTNNTGRESPAEPSAGPAAEYHKITPEEAKKMMDDDEAFILLDVRAQEEYDEYHIEGAILIPNTEIKKRAPDELPDKDARILVYCRSGRRSEQASRDLVNLGYTGVYDFGGIMSWPYETVR